MTPSVEITVTKVNGEEFQVLLSMTPETFAELEETARKRGTTLTEMFGEALRLERLFAKLRDSKDESLLIRKGNAFEELVAV